MLPLVSLCAAAAGGAPATGGGCWGGSTGCLRWRVLESCCSSTTAYCRAEHLIIMSKHSALLTGIAIQSGAVDAYARDLSTMSGSNNSYWGLIDELVGTTSSTIIRALADADVPTSLVNIWNKFRALGDSDDVCISVACAMLQFAASDEHVTRSLLRAKAVPMLLQILARGRDCWIDEVGSALCSLAALPEARAVLLAAGAPAALRVYAREPSHSEAAAVALGALGCSL